LFGGMGELELLARVLGDATTDPYTLVYQTITQIGANGGMARATDTGERAMSPRNTGETPVPPPNMGGTPMPLRNTGGTSLRPTATAGGLPMPHEPEKVFRQFLYDGLLADSGCQPVGAVEVRVDVAATIVAMAPNVADGRPAAARSAFCHGSQDRRRGVSLTTAGCRNAPTPSHA